MISVSRIAAAFLALVISVYCCASTVTVEMDNSWKPMPLTRYAKLELVPEGIQLTNSSDKEYAGMSRRFDVDLSATPWLIVEVKKNQGSGEFKALCGTVKVQFGRFYKPGKYQVNLAELLKTKEKKGVELCCYVLGKGSSAIFADFKLQANKDLSLDEPKFYIVPTFINAAYYYRGKSSGNVTPFFREKGAKEWTRGVDAAYDDEKKQYRGSIVRLKENTAYELKLVDGKSGEILRSGSFTTWADNVKVARTVELDPAELNDTLVIRDAGKPDGWIRYTQKPGTVIDFKELKSVIQLERASYVILEKLNIRGGGKHAIEINGCNNVRVSNCEITGWGIVGEQRCDYNGRFHIKGQTPNGYGINFNGAINIMHGKGVVVERCYIHGARNTANSWYYSHPAGPQAVTVGSPESCVIRYNDFVGSDDHRFNDAVESWGNFSKDGGLNRDADVYGNFMIYCSDDNIELDGGQQNIRCFDNRFEGSFCGVSIQGCMTGPSYVFDNIFLNMGDEFGYRGYTLKSCAGAHWGGLSRKNRCYIFNNTFTGVGGGTNIDVTMDYRNNIWGEKRKIDGASKPHTGSSNVFELFSPGDSYNMDNTMYGKVKFADLKQGDLSLASDSKFKGRGCAIPNFTASNNVDPGAFHRYADQPARPLGVSVEPRQINCTFANGKPSAPVEVTVKGLCEKFKGKFAIRKNSDFDWFEVVPSSGVIENSNELKLQLRIKQGFKPSAMKYRGAFLVRFENGLSRPVSVYMDTDYKYDPYPRVKGVYTDYIDLTKVTRGKQYPVISHPAGGKGKMVDFNSTKPLFKPKSSVYEGTEEDFSVYEFEVPSDGTYYIVLRGCVPENDTPLVNSCFLSLDGHPVVDQNLTLSFGKRIGWVWPKLPQSGKVWENKALQLKKGKHVLKIAPRKHILLDAACVTDDPRIFVTR